MKKKKVEARTLTNKSVNEYYKPSTFNPEHQRPGCMDFVNWPSRIGSHLFYRKDAKCKA